MDRKIKIKEFKYIFIEIGGGWIQAHNLYGVMPNGQVYLTNEFNEIELDTEVNCKFICKLDSIELGLQPVAYSGIMDAEFLTVLEVSDELKVLREYDCCEANNPTLFNLIKEAERSMSHWYWNKF